MNADDLELIREYTNAIKKSIAIRDPGGALWALQVMPRYLVPHVKYIIEENKEYLVKYILDKIKRYGLTDNLVVGSINGLDTARIDWPEINIIKKSIRRAEEQYDQPDVRVQRDDEP